MLAVYQLFVSLNSLNYNNTVTFKNEYNDIGCSILSSIAEKASDSVCYILYLESYYFVRFATFNQFPSSQQ